MHNVVEKKVRKWIHTTSCPPIREYGNGYKLRKYCTRCLYFVLLESSSDWRRASYVEKTLKIEKRKVRSLQDMCFKVIIEENIEFNELPVNLKNQIQTLKIQ